MKRSLLCSVGLFAATIVFSSAVFSESAPIEILSINVRTSPAKDGEDAWPNRRDFLADVVRARSYDFIGGQEVVVHPNDELNQIKFMTERLPEYGVLFLSREKTPERGEGMPIFYRKDRWAPDTVDRGFFWLSDTPDIPGSVTWKEQSTCPRIVTWALFHECAEEGERTGKRIYIYCTHFDHIGEPARQKGAELTLGRIAERKNKDVPIVLMGDLNTGEASATIRYLKGEAVELDGSAKTPPTALIDTYRTVYPDDKNVGTFHGFKGVDYVYNNVNKVGNKIDYIFVTPDLNATDAEIIRTKNEAGRYPTDHYPIRAVVQFAP